MKTFIHTKTWILKFLDFYVKWLKKKTNWKQPKYLSTVKWIKRKSVIFV